MGYTKRAGKKQKETTKTNARLLLASRNAHTGVVLFTWVLTFPRPILAEINTHRMLSRNTSSSRAIPVKKLRHRVVQDTFIPSSIGYNKSGMQADKEIEGTRRKLIEITIKSGACIAAIQSWLLEKLGAHKQISNRYLEPYSWVEQIVSATDVSNLFTLRAHRMAEPHFQTLAYQMKEQATIAKRILNNEVEPFVDGGNAGEFHDVPIAKLEPDIAKVCQTLRTGEWHLPFITKEDHKRFSGPQDKTGKFIIEWHNLKKVSAARCARVSYYLPENGQVSTIDRDVELHDRLAASTPKHLSPFEHQATPVRAKGYIGNFRSWKQYRKEFENESGEN
jgi:hypothetical protein